jgi:hypothetical protein
LIAAPVHRVEWRPSYRIVSSRFPPIGLFDAIASPEDLDALYELEGMTNPRLREQLGEIALLPPERRITGPGTTPIMAAFAHLNPEGSRFSPGYFGVYYAAQERNTAIAETTFHRERLLRRTSEPPCTLEMRCYLADINGDFIDIRGGWPALHDPDSYIASQRAAVEWRDQGNNGVVYDSARIRDGHCVAAFYPDLISPARQAEHLYYHWDGSRISHVVVAGEVMETSTKHHRSRA